MDEVELSRRIATGATLQQIADEAGVHFSTVRRWLRSYGLRTERMSAREAADAARTLRTSTLLRTCPRHGPVDHVRDSRGSYRCPSCNGEPVARHRRRDKEALVAQAGGCCVICGYRRCARALTFHHLDPATKEFGLAFRGAARSLDRAQLEAAKCVLLCANCHMEVEAGLVRVPGTVAPNDPG